MPDEQRRRGRRLPWRSGVLVALVALVAVEVGIDVGDSTKPEQHLDAASFLDAASGVLQDQPEQALLVERIRTRAMPAAALEATCAQLASTAAASAHAMHALAAEAASGPDAPRLEAVLDQRARAASELDTAVVQAVGGAAPAQVVGELVQVGTALQRADARYAKLAGLARRGTAGARWPASRWVQHADAWSPAALTTWVVSLSSLAPPGTVHDVAILTWTVTPLALRPASGGTPAMLAPVTSIGVTVVVADQGTVAERSVPVGVTVTPLGPVGGTAAPPAVAPAEARTSVALGEGGSTVVSFGGLAVTPGERYVIAVQAGPVDGVAGSGSKQSATIGIAPVGR